MHALRYEQDWDYDETEVMKSLTNTASKIRIPVIKNY